jgi:hypothetical protein
LTCLLLGKSLIFVAPRSTVLSHLVLGLEALLRPLLNWPFLVIPVLSDKQADYLFAPTPMLVGMTSKTFESIEEEHRAFKTWVFVEGAGSCRVEYDEGDIDLAGGGLERMEEWGRKDEGAAVGWEWVYGEEMGLQEDR